MNLTSRRFLTTGRFHLPGIILVLIFAVVYLLTLQNGLRAGELEGGDLITHQYAQVLGRPGNAPGYPLYTMGGWLWFHLWRPVLGPGSNPVSILSSYSTFWALLALWLLYRLILEATDRGSGGYWPVAFLSGAFYGVTYFFWYYAVTTENYSSAVAWTLAVVWLAFAWERRRRDWHLLAISLLAGVGLAHMPTVLLLLPPLLWFVLSGDRTLLRRPRLIAAAVGLAALPLLSYIYVYLGGALHPEWRGSGHWTSTWQWFWAFISTGQGRSELTWSWTPVFTSEFPSLIWRELTVLGTVAGVLGLAALGRRRAALTYASLAIYLVFCWFDRLGNWFQVIMPVYSLVVLGVALAANWARLRLGASYPAGDRTDFIRGGHSDSRRRYAGLAVAVVLGGLILYRGSASYPRANMHNRSDQTGLAPGAAILADNPPPGTAVMGTLPEIVSLDYMTQIWGRRPDVHGVSSDQARFVLAAGKPLAVTEKAQPLVAGEVSALAHYSALGRTLAMVSAGPGNPQPAGTGDRSAQPRQHEFNAAIRLADAQVTRNPATGEVVVLLTWQARAAPADDWSVSVRLAEGVREIALVDQESPVHGAYPTSRWSPGETIGDAYPFALPAGAQPDGLAVILYRRQGDGSFLNLDAARFALP